MEGASLSTVDSQLTREVEVRRSASKRLWHPAVGWLDLEREALHDPDSSSSAPRRPERRRTRR
ncbi:hypothetical protein [Amycolatopsis sp. CA-230715]|uniref:hypothetical protein n=1 Tax=Amycolatopsis sp. CA-230715 TaxID=2745196 RepID=UPI001C02F3AE|nr:hypothetical protein [Amycolatopsis sp. CA-230715]